MDIKSRAQKAKEEKLFEEERMMAAHGMQQINLNPFRNDGRNVNESGMISDNDVMLNGRRLKDVEEIIWPIK